jgi:hypothetical protein
MADAAIDAADAADSRSKGVSTMSFEECLSNRVWALLAEFGDLREPPSVVKRGTGFQVSAVFIDQQAAEKAARQLHGRDGRTEAEKLERPTPWDSDRVWAQTLYDNEQGVFRTESLREERSAPYNAQTLGRDDDDPMRFVRTSTLHSAHLDVSGVDEYEAVSRCESKDDSCVPEECGNRTISGVTGKRMLRELRAGGVIKGRNLQGIARTSSHEGVPLRPRARLADSPRPHARISSLRFGSS